MVVQSIDEKTKIIITVWFSPANKYQQGTFLTASLDKVESKAKPKAK
jgi:hypothetical protein